MLWLLCSFICLSGCNCTRPSKTRVATTEPSTLFNSKAKKAPTPPEVTADLQCNSTTMAAQAQLLAPTVGFIMKTGPENGMEQLDSLSQGLGIDTVCCANLIVYRAFSTISPEEVSWDIRSAAKRSLGFIMERCIPKNVKESNPAL